VQITTLESESSSQSFTIVSRPSIPGGIAHIDNALLGLAFIERGSDQLDSLLAPDMRTPSVNPNVRRQRGFAEKPRFRFI